MTAALTAFLLARIAEDEADARRVKVELETYPPSAYDAAQMPMCDAGDPDRVLARCAADRRIVELHELSPYYGLDRHGRWLPRDGEPKFWYCDCESDDGMIGRDGPCGTLRALAGVYADHPDYREEWLS